MSMALILESSQPARILAVTGRPVRRTIASIMPAARVGSHNNAEPAPCRVTFLTGQPMFTSMMSAPSCAAISAPAAMVSGSPPKSCTQNGDSVLSRVRYMRLRA